jgi:hypothetical protein
LVLQSNLCASIGCCLLQFSRVGFGTHALSSVCAEGLAFLSRCWVFSFIPSTRARCPRRFPLPPAFHADSGASGLRSLRPSVFELIFPLVFAAPGFLISGEDTGSHTSEQNVHGLIHAVLRLPLTIDSCRSRFPASEIWSSGRQA